ncbi:MAG TPA: histidine kinase [Mycobacteriales bacterium]|nr:histidine kinase [Mycobacteriales bacterium]
MGEQHAQVPQQRPADDVVAEAAAQHERAQLARDLHGSVAAALVALHQRAQLVDRALAQGDDDLLRRAAADLRPLTEQALEELRRLVAERRPGSDGATGRGTRVDVRVPLPG